MIDSSIERVFTDVFFLKKSRYNCGKFFLHIKVFIRIKEKEKKRRDLQLT